LVSVAKRENFGKIYRVAARGRVGLEHARTLYKEEEENENEKSTKSPVSAMTEGGERRIGKHGNKSRDHRGSPRGETPCARS